MPAVQFAQGWFSQAPHDSGISVEFVGCLVQAHALPYRSRYLADVIPQVLISFRHRVVIFQ